MGEDPRRFHASSYPRPPRAVAAGSGRLREVPGTARSRDASKPGSSSLWVLQATGPPPAPQARAGQAGDGRGCACTQETCLRAQACGRRRSRRGSRAAGGPTEEATEESGDLARLGGCRGPTPFGNDGHSQADPWQVAVVPGQAGGRSVRMAARASGGTRRTCPADPRAPHSLAFYHRELRTVRLSRAQRPQAGVETRGAVSSGWTGTSGLLREAGRQAVGKVGAECGHLLFITSQPPALLPELGANPGPLHSRLNTEISYWFPLAFSQLRSVVR